MNGCTNTDALKAALRGVLHDPSSRSGRGAVRSGGDHAATSSAVLLRSWVVPQIQFIDRVDRLRDGVLFVLSSVVNRDRYQSFLPSGLGFGFAVH